MCKDLFTLCESGSESKRGQRTIEKDQRISNKHQTEVRFHSVLIDLKDMFRLRFLLSLGVNEPFNKTGRGTLCTFKQKSSLEMWCSVDSSESTFKSPFTQYD